MRTWVLLASLLVALPAEAALDLAWDCYLPQGPTDCVQLETAFFTNPAYVRAPPEAVADASLTLRSASMADGMALVVAVRAKDGAELSYTDHIPGGFSDTAVLLRVVGVLQKCTAHLFVVDEPGTLEDGVLQLSLRDPDAGPRNAVQADQTTLWYVAPSLGLMASRTGITQLEGNAFVAVNWSHPDWRLKGATWGNYQLVLTDPVTGTEKPEELRYEVWGGGTDWVVARSLWQGFSLAANGYAMHDPQNNYQLLAGAWVGAEWVLVPFLKTDEGNYGVQYVFGAERHEYVLPNVLDLDRYTYLRHRVRLFGAWHFSRVDLQGRLSWQSPVTDPRFSTLSATSSLRWRILDNFSLSVNGEVSYRTALLNEPRDEGQENPLAQYFGGSAYNAVTFWSWVSLEYVFGNSLLRSQEQRWN